jgi:LysM repeat protein
MERFIRYISGVVLLFAFAEAGVIECRSAVEQTEECNPYSKHFYEATEILYEPNRKRLITEKTLPAPLKAYMWDISLESLAEKYVKVDDSLRFKGMETENNFEALIRKKSEKLPETVFSQSERNETKIPEVPRKKPEAEIHAPHITESGIYVVKKGDTLSKMAVMFGIRTRELMRLNGLKKKDHLSIGQKLRIPMRQKVIDAIVNAKYTIENGDYLIGIAKMFGITPKALADANHIRYSADVRVGRVLRLPLPYKLAKQKAKQKEKKARRKKKKRSKFISRFGKHRLRVTATAYTSHRGQTDKTPFLAAWNNRLRPGVKSIAVSRDLLTKYGMKNGTKVKIAGLSGYYRVRDKMNKRYKKRIDIYMGMNRRRALRWGRRSVVIYW